MQKDLHYWHSLLNESKDLPDFLNLLNEHIKLVADVRNKIPGSSDSLEIRTAISSYLQHVVDSIKRTKDNNTKITANNREPISDDML